MPHSHPNSGWVVLDTVGLDIGLLSSAEDFGPCTDAPSVLRGLIPSPFLAFILREGLNKMLKLALNLVHSPVRP